jgi:hypothetical protein
MLKWIPLSQVPIPVILDREEVALQQHLCAETHDYENAFPEVLLKYFQPDLIPENRKATRRLMLMGKFTFFGGAYQMACGIMICLS